MQLILQLAYTRKIPVLHTVLCHFKTDMCNYLPLYFWNQILSTKHKKMQEQDKRRITTHFVPLIPLLLAKVHLRLTCLVL